MFFLSGKGCSEFPKRMLISIGILNHFANYNKNINATINIKKNTMTGNGNTAEAVLKYIHTYQKTTGSVSMNVGSDSVSAGFTLSNVKNQWSLVCNITGIYY